VNKKRFSQLCCEEPFRILFPLGLLWGGIGVLLWPLSLLGITTTYPAIAHARLMIEGMMSCFIFGFLGTAGPRVLSARHFSGWEVGRLLGAVNAAALAHLWDRPALGDTFFLAGLLLFAASLARRFREREDSPPPNFALVGLGLANGIVGAAILVYCEWTGSAPIAYRLGASLLDVGFVLLPLLGVGPFFLHRLLDLPNADERPRAKFMSFAPALLTGLTIDASFLLELFSANPAIGWIRCAVALGFLALTVPLRGRNHLATSLRMSLATLAAGLGLMAVLPAYRISALHVLFIGGFSLAVFSVGTRVVLGHSGNHHLLRTRQWLFFLALLLLLVAMIARFTSDFVATRNQHLIGAAILWLAAAALWGVLVLPHVSRSEPE